MDRFPNLTGPAGAAFLLSTAPKEGIIFDHPSGRVCLRVSAPYVSVELNNKPVNGDVRSVAWRVVQESLDVLSASGRASLVTSKGDTEHLCWVRTDDAYELTCVTTAEVQWSMQAHLTVGDQTAALPSFFHHESLRYYRMSKCTSDLFDAYRNAYMGFECLVSSESPKRSNESELDWLKRVVNGPLREGVPGGIEIDLLLRSNLPEWQKPAISCKSRTDLSLSAW